MVICTTNALGLVSPLTNFSNMKQIFTSITLIFIALQLSAQITIERSDYTREFDDTVVRITADNPEAFTTPEAGEDMLWDYSGISFPIANAGMLASLVESSAPEMPDANIVLAGTNTGAFLPGLTFEVTNYEVLDEEGYRHLGQSHLPIDYPIGAITGTATDSINFLYVLNDFTDPTVYVEFPMTYGSADVNHYNYNNDLLITATPFGLDHTPGNIQFQYAQELTVNGWGNVSITNPLDGEIVEIEVLMVKELTIEVDSAFLGGGPAPQSLLNNFGIIQGAVDTIRVNYEFWAKGLDNPLMRINVLADGTYNGFLNAGAATLVSTSEKILDQLIPIAVSPNPSSGDFRMNFIKDNTADWTLEVHNFIGQVVHHQTIRGGQGTVNQEVSIQTKSPGTHVYLIRNEVGTVVGAGKILLQ